MNLLRPVSKRGAAREYTWFRYRAAGTLYMVQKLIYYTINLGGQNTVKNGQKRSRTDENILSLVAAP